MRRRPAVKKKIMADAKYGDVLVTRFVNYLMWRGKKSVVEKAVYASFAMIESRLKKDALEVFKAAVGNVVPKVEVRSRRIGGATYQIPVEVPERRATALALKWLKAAIRKASGRSLGEKVFNALNEAFENRGVAVKKREEVFRMAEANKAFSHYRW